MLLYKYHKIIWSINQDQEGAKQRTQISYKQMVNNDNWTNEVLINIDIVQFYVVLWWGIFTFSWAVVVTGENNSIYCRK